MSLTIAQGERLDPILSDGAKELASSILSRADRITLAALPETRAGDELFAYALFCHWHKRAPTNEMLFNDVIYRIKTTSEILNPLRVFITDKEFVKLYVKAQVGDDYNVPTLDVINNPNDIKISNLRSCCCIKPTHLSGEVVFRTDDNQRIELECITNWFSINWYRKTREANYLNLTPKVIIEPLVFGRPGATDYKFFCFNGKAKLIQVDMDRGVRHRRAFLTTDWVLQDFSIRVPRTQEQLPAPRNLVEMLEVAETLAKPFGFVRVDLYSDGRKCLVGEITNCPGNANRAFTPRMGEYTASQIIFGR